MATVGHLPDAIVLARVADQTHFHSVVKLEVVALVWRFVRSYRHWVDVGAKDEILLLLATQNCLRCSFCLFKGSIQLARLLKNLLNFFALLVRLWLLLLASYALWSRFCQVRFKITIRGHAITLE